MHEHLRHRLLGWWAGVVCDHPRPVVAIGLVLAAAGAAIALLSLRFQPDRNALISQDIDWNERFLEYRENFAFNDLIVVIAAPPGPAGRTQAEQYADALAVRAQADVEHVRRVFWRIDTWEASAAAIRMADFAEFAEALERMGQSRAVLEARHLADVLAAAARQAARAQGESIAVEEASARLGELQSLVGSVAMALDGAAAGPIAEELKQAMGERYRYLDTAEGRLLLMQVVPRLAEDELEPVKPAVAAVRGMMAELAPRFPEVEAGLTGLPVIQSDETDVTQRDATLASFLAVAVIAVVMVWAFHSLLVPLLIVASLAFGVAWSFGYLTLAIGHLQLLSVVFTVFLLGLGVDFGIHLISRFELVRDRYPAGPPGFRQTMIDAMQTVGPGIATGAITTAVAFGTTLLTRFRGMAEMGHIAAVGILLCLLAMFTLLPALMRLVRPRRRHIRPVHHRRVNIYEHHWWTPFHQRPWITLAAALAVTAVGVYGATFIRYDYNLSNLLPRDLESVQWFNRLAGTGRAATVAADEPEGAAEKSRPNIWFAASVVPVDDGIDAALTEAKRRTEAFRELDPVASVGGVGMLFPEDAERKRERFRAVRAELGDLLDAPLPDARPASAEELAGSLRQLRDALVAGEGAGRLVSGLLVGPMRQQLGRLAERVGAMPEAEAAARLATLNEAFAAWRDGLRQRIDGALSTRPLGLEDMPAPLHRQAVGGEGEQRVLLLQVYPKGNIYDPQELEPFVRSVQRVDVDATGPAVQIYNSSLLMQNSYLWAGLYAVIAVFVLVLLDFQRLVDAALCLVPVAMAFVLLLGIMGANDMPINPANIMVLPLLFGIGVDCGVHILHRYRQAPNEHPPGLAAGTGKGITLTSLTTIIGFASLMIASHRGIASLGFTLAVGMALTLLVCLTVMPAILELYTRARHRRAAAIADDAA